MRRSLAISDWIRSRRHSAAFKASVVAACKPGVSIASVALANGLNANLLRRWVVEAESARPALTPASRTMPVAPGFMPLPVESAAAAQEIRIEIQRGGCAVVVSWPVSAAAECSAWLRELLR